MSTADRPLVDLVEQLDTAHRAVVNAAQAAQAALEEWREAELDAARARQGYMRALAIYEAHRGRST